VERRLDWLHGATRASPSWALSKDLKSNSRCRFHQELEMIRTWSCGWRGLRQKQQERVAIRRSISVHVEGAPARRHQPDRCRAHTSPRDYLPTHHVARECSEKRGSANP
jgi:hypothetical protein